MTTQDDTTGSWDRIHVSLCMVSVYVLSVGVWSSEEICFEHDLDKLLLTDLPISVFVCLIQHTLQEIVSLQHQLSLIVIITHYTTWSSNHVQNAVAASD